MKSVQRGLVSALFTLLPASACAVHISPSGTGQVLIFPYYTVRGGFDTLISVVNTQTNTKSVKVRFREGMNGRDVANFNLFLAPNDAWTGAVIGTPNGARLISNDNSCVTPSDLFTEVRTVPGGQSFNEFFNFQYTGVRQDAPANSSLDRTREGYFEIIEMGVIDPSLSSTAAKIVGFVKPDVYTNAASNCAAMDAFEGLTSPQELIRFPNTGAALMAPPRGGLKGRASLINAATGANYSYSPTALDGWSSQVAYSQPGSTTGTLLRDASPATSMVMTLAGAVIARWAEGRDAVSAALMRESLMNEFVLDAGTVSQTDWIVTLPTKPFYTDPIFGNNNSSVREPFGGFFSSDGTTGCDRYEPAGSNREGYLASSLVTLRPPPPQGAGQDSVLCRAANVVPFQGSFTAEPFPGTFVAASLLGTPTPSQLYYYFYENLPRAISRPSAATTRALTGTQGPNGRVTLLFNQPQQQLTPLSAVLVTPSGTQTTITGKHIGLPMIGLMLHNNKNASVTSRYGGVVEHAFSVRVD